MAGPTTGPFVYVERADGRKTYLNAANITYITEIEDEALAYFGDGKFIRVKLTPQALTLKIQDAIVDESLAIGS